MKSDEFAFFNQQLAAMLRDGIPLEGALRRLCEEMRKGPLRSELQLLELDLERGVPLSGALEPLQLPELYKRMVLVGVRSGDLPGALIMLADYFQSQSNLWRRMKGLMVYPLLVVFTAFLISLLLAILWLKVIGPSLLIDSPGWNMPVATASALEILRNIWIFPVAFGALFVAFLAVVFVPGLRSKFRWLLPAFKEASVSRIASSVHLLLKNGVNLPDAIGLVEKLEDNPGAVADLKRWAARIASGVKKFAEVAAENRLFPPMFVWVVSNAGEDLTGGFHRAAEMYQSRAVYRTEVALYSVLPVSVLFLGAIVLSEAYLVVSLFLAYFAWLT